MSKSFAQMLLDPSPMTFGSSRLCPIARIPALVMLGAAVATVLAAAGCGSAGLGAADAIPAETQGDADGAIAGDIHPVEVEVDVQQPDDPSRCWLPPRVPSGGIALEVAFPHLLFSQPVFITHSGDGSNRLFVAEQTGKLRVFPNVRDVAQAGTFLDLTDRVTKTDGEGGLLGVAFPSDFPQSGRFFVNYTTGSGADFRSVVSQFRVSEPDASQADLASELVVLELAQPYSNHNGGMLAFGPDGMLYLGFGDGGSGGDPKGHGQNLGTLLGAILRIDVSEDALRTPLGYGIPADNPFVGVPGARGEIWAYGVRNPWRFSFDPATGLLWLGDVGQDEFEEVHIVERGKNYGWNVMEASACYPLGASCDPTGLELPILEYPHSLGRSITGGVVVRGSRLPSLFGTYLYADFRDRLLFAYAHGEEAPAPRVLLSAGVPNVASFGVDQAGEIYIAGFDGRIHQLVEVPVVADVPPVPTRLSDTHCFADLATLAPVDHVIGYEPIAPFWSDGAHKERLFSPPEGAQIAVTADGQLQSPNETVFIKHFFFDVVRPGGTEAVRTPVETRFLIVEQGEPAQGEPAPAAVRGYSYRWNEDGTDAELLDAGATRTLRVTDEAGAQSDVIWTFPGPNQCESCHTEASGGPLGFTTAQLQWAGTHGTAEDRTQLEQWVEQGWLQEPPGDSEALVSPFDASAPLAARARSYLQTNCASCHRPAGATGVELDMRFETPLADSGLCGPATKEAFGLQAPRVIRSGAPEQSVLWLRMGATPAHRMPPLATTVIDEAGRQLLAEWITTGPCPDQ